MSLRSSESVKDPSPRRNQAVYNHPGEPAMYLQRPTSERSQDISHIFSSTFRELFTKDAVSAETVKHLAQSRAGRSSYHERYAERLQQVQSNWEQEINLIDKLEAHILSAESKARETEREMTELAIMEWPDYNKLGLPPVPSQLLSYLDSSLLKSKNLITPEDFISDDAYQAYPSSIQEHSTPNYYESTASSQRRYSKIQPETNYRPEKDRSAPPAKFFAASEPANISRTSQSVGVFGQEDILERKIHGVSADLKLRSATKVWKESLKPQHRQADREDLSRMQQKADFLKNPRFSGPEYSTKLQKNNQLDETQKNESTTNCSVDFAVSPCPVLFTNYEPGNVYEATIRLKNITTTSRQLRVVPPSSKYFSVSLGQFPSENGVVAPGMSCQYTVFFKPDSLADFYDDLQVETLSSKSLPVPIKAKRTPPELKLPASFDCGYALVNTTKEMKFECHNIGGPGRFCIMPQKHWPTVEWTHTLDCPGYLDLDGFHFEPAICYLKTGDRITFKVTFSPTAVTTYNENIVFICDNCQVKVFKVKGVGELAGVELESIERGFSEYKLGESRDQSCQFLVRFDDQHPLSTENRKLYIRNTTAVTLGYKWQFGIPNLGGSPVVLPTALVDISNDTASAPFSVTPSCGNLEPNSISVFDLMFHSQQVGSFHSVLNFVLKKIPSNGNKGEFTDVLAISLELKGKSKPHQIIVSPPALFLGGEYLTSTTFSQKILMGNSSVGDVQYYWPPFENDLVFISMQPERGMLGREEKAEIDILITGKKAGRVKEAVSCQVPYAEENIYIYVDMTFVGPELEIAPCFLDFGLVRHLDHHTQEFCVLNRSSIPLTWSIEKAKDNICAGNDEMITLEPQGGFLEPLEEQNVIVNLNACHAMVLRSIYAVRVEGGQERFLEISANVQRPLVCMDCSTLKVTRCFLDIPVIEGVKLYNQTLLTSKYRFYKVIGNDFAAAEVSFYPSEGTMKPRESTELEITFIGKRQGKVNDFIALFEVEGAVDFLPLLIEAHVEGLSVEYSIPTEEKCDELNEPPPDLEIDFGRFALIGKVVERSFMIRNKTAITCKFVVAVEFFPAHEDLKALEDTALATSTQEIRPVLKKFETSINSRVGAEKQLEVLAKTYLSKGNGVCFVAWPSEGSLGPFAQQTITLSAFSDMWGEYNDVVLCQVGDLTVQRIPIHINVVGSPLNLQMSKEQPSVIRFGSHLSGSESVKRRVRVNNTSPCDIRTHWEPYVLDWDDTQLLDLVVYIGKAFPDPVESGSQDDNDDDLSDPLIRVHLSVHQGQQTTKPFDIQPKQLVVPAKGHATIEVLFHPLEGIRIPTDFIGYALGYMCLQKKDLNVGDRCLRLDGENTLPFTINMTGAVKPARIWLECHEDDGFNFYVPVSNLVKEIDAGKFQLLNEWNLCHTLAITNSTGAKLMLNVTTEDPFQVELENDIKKKTSKKKASDYGRDLQPFKSCEVKINLKLSLGLLERIANRMDPPQEKADSEYKVTKLDRQLRINFSNGSCQKQTVTAHLIWPCIKLSTTEIDCGVCFVGNTISKELSISNSGGAAYYWIAQNDPSYPEASQSAFQLSPRSGSLNPILGKHANRPKQSLSITFCPRQNVTYEARIFLVGQLYDPLLSIRLLGSGSFDQVTRRSSISKDLGGL